MIKMLKTMVLTGLISFGITTYAAAGISANSFNWTTKSTIVPKPLRGTWYSYDSANSGYEKLILTKNKWYLRPAGTTKPIILYSNRYRADIKEPQFYVYRYGHHGYYNIEQNGSDYRVILKRSTYTYHGHTYAALRDWDPFEHGYDLWLDVKS